MSLKQHQVVRNRTGVTRSRSQEVWHGVTQYGKEALLLKDV